jgi:hypothetical protein
MKVCYYDVAHVVSSESPETNTGTTSSSPLADGGAWRILEQLLSTDMTYPDTMEEALLLYLGDRYFPDDWKNARDALFSGDGDNSIALANLLALRANHVLQTVQSSGSSEISGPQKKLPTVTPALKMHERISNTRARRSKVSQALICFR